MIGSLRGRVLRVDGATALIEVAGVGYEVEMPGTSLAQLPQEAQSETFIYVHHSVREDAQQLYGFMDFASRALFRILIKVNGIGPKSALAALSTFDVESLVNAVMDGRASELTQIPGVGKKTAERMIVELKDLLKNFPLSKGNTPVAGTAKTDHGFFDEAVAALVALGYKEVDAVKYCKSVDTDIKSVEELIKAALSLISKNRR